MSTVYISTYVPKFFCWFFKLKTEAHAIFLIRLPLFIVQTEVCRLSVC